LSGEGVAGKLVEHAVNFAPENVKKLFHFALSLKIILRNIRNYMTCSKNNEINTINLENNFLAKV